ncbi:peptidyl-tRNA hydrolase, PTH1 family [Desulfonatronum thiosulfatophilum]|uniref:Peptidyl-tRNA hydrolase n=1 Tax=Desulfonatronum thiosulfatophilum TaxID=617002 RepID=A0A1G6EDP2_9BACT|nr:aminoacyl-tRNA hydrolase [Desulfonatronum thiosulfatophilum]SDB55502.1 peptidyl-tRNA hydrolase, PTH1 family [Desulfonatronum thiosulfatophilum]
MINQGFRGIIVGLGNPGTEYHRTPHNLGFLALDALFAARHSTWRIISSPVPKCELWRGDFGGETWLAAKPSTYMNRSGDAVGPLIRWYRLGPENLIVVHDDLDLQPGTVRFKMGGGAAGHKGILSISSALGTNEFARLRLGIGRPPKGHDPAGYVLRNIQPELDSVYSEVLGKSANALTTFCTKGISVAMMEYHSNPKLPSPGQTQSA